MSGLDTRARAKLNLSLDVLARRPDGFHDLRMVMQAAALADEVHVELREPGFFRAETNRSYIPTDERNIAVKAAKAYFEAAGIDSGAYIKITKRIPVCAGLGGGSSDAAAVIRALGELTGAPLEGGELCAAALKAGSDVPFCLLGGTALATGRGEVLTPLPPLPRTDAVICMPHFTCSTPELFARLDTLRTRCRPDTDGLVAALRAGDVAEGTTFGQLCARAQKKLHAAVRAFGNAETPVHALGCCSGAGGSEIGEALALGADCFITGEVRHHEALDALDRGCCIIEAGHFETENPVCEVLADALQKAADALQYNVTVFCLKDDPFGR